MITVTIDVILDRRSYYAISCVDVTNMQIYLHIILIIWATSTFPILMLLTCRLYSYIYDVGYYYISCVDVINRQIYTYR